MRSVTDRLRQLDLSVAELAILVAIGVVLNLYFLTTLSLSPDDEFAALRGDPRVWLGQGRWTVYLFERFLFPQPAIPFAPFVVLIACQAIAYALITRAHDYPTSWKTYACYPLFCAYPTWWFVSEFYANTPAISLGLALTAASGYLTCRDGRGGRLGHSVSFARGAAIAALLAIALGAYQSLILLYFCIVAGVATTYAMRSDLPGLVLSGQVARKLLQAIVLSAAGLALYEAVNRLAQGHTGTFNPQFAAIVSAGELLRSPGTVITRTWNEAQQIYAGNASLFGADIPSAVVLLALATLAIALVGRVRAVVSLCLWAVVLATPFALHLVMQAVPMRALLALPYVTWLMGTVVVTARMRAVAALGAAAVAIFSFQVLTLLSQFIAAATITQAHDRMLAADIYRRIGELSPEFDRNVPIAVDVWGYDNFHTVYAAPWSSATQGSFFYWDHGSLWRMLGYMKLMGYPNLRPLVEDDQRAMTPFFADMPVWPAAGCVRKVGSRYLVRLSREPDPIHQSAIADGNRPP